MAEKQDSSRLAAAVQQIAQHQPQRPRQWRKLLKKWHPQHKVSLCSQEHKLDAVFARLDVKGEGSLLPQHFSIGLLELGVDLPSHALDTLASSVADHEGRIKYDEFTA